jgi:hypothetical protein
VEWWWLGLPYIGSGRRGGGHRGRERSAEVWFKGGELRGRLLGRGRGGGAVEGGEKRRRASSVRSRAEEVACGVAAPARPTAAQATEVGDEQGSRPSGLRRPVGQLGRSGPRRPGGARWAGTE